MNLIKCPDYYYINVESRCYDFVACYLYKCLAECTNKQTKDNISLACLAKKRSGQRFSLS